MPLPSLPPVWLIMRIISGLSTSTSEHCDVTSNHIIPSNSDCWLWRFNVHCDVWPIPAMDRLIIIIYGLSLFARDKSRGEVQAVTNGFHFGRMLFFFVNKHVTGFMFRWDKGIAFRSHIQLFLNLTLSLQDSFIFVSDVFGCGTQNCIGELIHIICYHDSSYTLTSAENRTPDNADKS